MPRKKPRHTGVLAEPTPWPFCGVPVEPEKKAILGLFFKKLEALPDHYNIPGGMTDPGNGWKLALCLASDHIEGFAPTIPKSKRAKHRPYDLHVGARDLILCMEGDWAKMENRSEREAVRNLGDRWRKSGKCSWSDKTLWRHYQRLRRRVSDSGLTDGMKEAARVLGGGS